MTLTNNLILPKGVSLRGSRIQIFFVFSGIQCRELLPKKLVVSQSTLNYAKRKLDSIRLEIEEDRFDYIIHFPKSKRALKLEQAPGIDVNRTIKQGIDLWLEVCAESKPPSTMEGYRAKAKRAKVYFDNKKITSLIMSDVIKYRSYLIEKAQLEVKTVNDCFTPIRQALKQAKRDGIIEQDVLAHVPNLKLDDEQDSQANPYTTAELERIELVKNRGFDRPQLINMLLFACWSGLSLSEMIALAWEDIDLNTMKIKVRRAYVCGGFKVPKEVSRTREFELLQPAINLLLDQKKYTHSHKPTDVQVLRRSNVKYKEQSISLIFKNDYSTIDTKQWHSKAVQSGYANILKKADVKYRGPNQSRHTHASMLITKFVPLDIIAAILGHTSIKMLLKHYAKIIPEDRPNVAKVISEIIGIEYAYERKKEL